MALRVEGWWVGWELRIINGSTRNYPRRSFCKKSPGVPIRGERPLDRKDDGREGEGTSSGAVSDTSGAGSFRTESLKRHGVGSTAVRLAREFLGEGREP